MHILLQRAGVPGPYLLVGFSLGGLNARVYAGLYPDEVTGAVLVDAAHEDEPRRAPKFMLGRALPRTLWHPLWLAAQIVRLVGVLRLTSPESYAEAEASLSRDARDSAEARPIVNAGTTNHPGKERTRDSAGGPGDGCRCGDGSRRHHSPRYARRSSTNRSTDWQQPLTVVRTTTRTNLEIRTISLESKHMSGGGTKSQGGMVCLIEENDFVSRIAKRSKFSQRPRRVPSGLTVKEIERIWTLPRWPPWLDTTQP